MKIAAILLSLLLWLPPPAYALADWEEGAGDVVTAAVPLTALVIAWQEDDNEGRQQWLWSTTAGLAVNSALRYGLKDTEWSTRPNGHPYGFPSGHTGFVASGAAFLSERYGWRYGLPAWAATGYVAYVRVESEHHHWRDVIAGALVAYGVSRIFVTPQGSLEASPVIDEDKAGLQLTYRFS
ncbi:MAG TPA: phosphatase PAP2 family protein [Verrucomicrobiae bacterium]|nr:phosphatase PAP2 family protein [Verrucomicrobiae bacterium]